MIFDIRMITPEEVYDNESAVFRKGSMALRQPPLMSTTMWPSASKPRTGRLALPESAEDSMISAPGSSTSLLIMLLLCMLPSPVRSPHALDPVCPSVFHSTAG